MIFTKDGSRYMITEDGRLWRQAEGSFWFELHFGVEQRTRVRS